MGIMRGIAIDKGTVRFGLLNTAFRVLCHIKSEGPALSQKEIGQAAKFWKTTINRLNNNFGVQGYLVQPGRQDPYVLGLVVEYQGCRASNQFDISAAVIPILVRLIKNPEIQRW